MFPSITVCNLNQVEASFLSTLNVSGNMVKTQVLIDEFLLGNKNNKTDEEKQIVMEATRNHNLSEHSFSYQSSQRCYNQFISMSFQGKTLSWKNYVNSNDVGPYDGYPTDFGSCCLLVPHRYFEPTNPNLTPIEYYHGLKADSLNGESNGLDIVIDAEQFNYAYHKSNAPGFKISLHQHTDR